MTWPRDRRRAAVPPLEAAQLANTRARDWRLP